MSAPGTAIWSCLTSLDGVTLIDQMQRDPSLRNRFAEIKRHRNYRCYHDLRRAVHVGKCVRLRDCDCEERFEVCPYWIQKMKADEAPSVLTGFVYLMSEGQAQGQSDTYLGTGSLLNL